MPTAYEYVQWHARNFTLEEWTDPTILTFVDSRVLEALDDLRDAFGGAIFPSKRSDGWARTSGSDGSQHYAVGRLSTACDIFPDHPVMECWLEALADRRWGGFGLYLDTLHTPTQPAAMMHLDLRPGKRILWVRNEMGRYVYEHKDPDRFWELVSRVPKHKRRTRISQ